MYHRAIHISSVNIIKPGQHKTEIFWIKVDPVIKLDTCIHTYIHTLNLPKGSFQEQKQSQSL